MALLNGDQSKSYLSKLVQQGLNSFKAFSYESITVDGTVKNLTIPADARYALITVESSVTSGVVARYLETKQTTVSTTAGLALRDGSVIDITDAQNLSQFQITQAQAGTHVIKVQYCK